MEYKNREISNLFLLGENQETSFGRCVSHGYVIYK